MSEAGPPPSSSPDRGSTAWFIRRAALALLLGATALAFAVVVARAGEVLLLLFAGTLFARFLSGVAGGARRYLPLPYGVLLGLLVVLVLALVALSCYLLAPRLIEQFSEGI